MSLVEVGRTCKEYRESINLYQYDVAKDVGCSKENVSAFERGKNNNASILLWYIAKGLVFDADLLEEVCLNGADV